MEEYQNTKINIIQYSQKSFPAASKFFFFNSAKIRGRSETKKNNFYTTISRFKSKYMEVILIQWKNIRTRKLINSKISEKKFSGASKYFIFILLKIRGRYDPKKNHLPFLNKLFRIFFLNVYRLLTGICRNCCALRLREKTV